MNESASGQLGGKDDVRQVQGPRLDTSSPDRSAAQGRPKKRGHVVLEAFVDASAEHDLGRYLEDVRRAFANDFSCYVHELYPDARVHARVTVEGE